MQFGRYKVIEQLGAGAMGEVFKATDTRVHDRVVAVKVLIDRLSRSDQAVRRFETEVKTAATLNHPNIIAIQDRGETEDGRPFFVMEYLEGDDLKRYTSGQEELPIDRRLDLAGQIADALDYAHERGVVHRDVKPSNIFVVRHGDQFQAKLLDFGIVHVEGSDLTQTTDQPGTSNYMAPEVLKGIEATVQSDLFSLGIVLYELFTFAHPFQASTQPLIISRIMNEEPDRPRKANPELPHQVEAMILRLLEKEPEDRPPRAKETAEALRGIAASLRSTGVSGTPSDFSSADEMTRQTIRTFNERARRFESEGDLEEALKLRKLALALAPDNAKLQRKVDSLAHAIQRSSKIRSLLSTARAAIDAKDLSGARVAFEDAWLIARDDSRVIDFKARLELAEAQQEAASSSTVPGVEPEVPEDPGVPETAKTPEALVEPEAPQGPEPPAESAVPAAPAELHPEFANALELHYQGAGKDRCRQLLTAYLRQNPGDIQAVQALTDILADRDPTVEGYEPPPPWTEQEGKRLEALTERIRKISVIGASEPAEFREHVAKLESEVQQLGRGLADSDRLKAVEQAITETAEKVESGVRDKAGRLAAQLARVLATGGVAVGQEARQGVEAIVSRLRSVDGTQAIDSTVQLLVEAGEAKQSLDQVLEQTHAELKQEIRRLSGESASSLGRRIDAWAVGSEQSLGELLAETSEAIAAEIDLWSSRVEETRALDEKALVRLRAVAAELRAPEDGRAASSARVGIDAIEALKSSHAAYLGALEGERQSVARQFHDLAKELPSDQSTAVRKFLDEPLPLRLADARRLVETVQAMLDSARERRASRIEAQTAEVRSVLDDPWLEADVPAIDRATAECEELLVAARATREARAGLRRAIEPEGGDQGDVDRLMADARKAIETSRATHENAQGQWSDRVSELERDLSGLTDPGMPGRVRQRASRIRFPESPASDPAGIRAYVQQASRAAAELDTLLSKIAKLVPAKLREAEGLSHTLRRKSRGLRFPRISRARRQEIDDCLDRLQPLIDGQDLTLAEIVPVVKRGRVVVRSIPINLLPWLSGAGVAVVLGAAVWFVVAKREVRIEAGLAVAEIRMEAEDGTPVVGERDGRVWTFKVRPGAYKVWYQRPGSTQPVGEQNLDVSLAQRPAPLKVRKEQLGDSYQDRMKDILEQTFPNLVD